MSNTPRTDAEAYDIDVIGDAYTKKDKYPSADHVSAVFARQLETELQVYQRGMVPVMVENPTGVFTVCGEFCPENAAKIKALSNESEVERLKAELAQSQAREAQLRSSKLAEQIACSLWGYFEGDSAGSGEAMLWFENNKNMGGPKHVIERVQSLIIHALTSPPPPVVPAEWKTLAEELGDALKAIVPVMELQPPPTLGQWNWPQLVQIGNEAIAKLSSLKAKP